MFIIIPPLSEAGGSCNTVHPYVRTYVVAGEISETIEDRNLKLGIKCKKKRLSKNSSYTVEDRNMKLGAQVILEELSVPKVLEFWF